MHNIGEKLQRPRYRFVISGVFILLAGGLLLVSERALDAHVEREITRATEAVDSGLLSDEEYLLRQARELDESRVFDRHIRARDTAQLLSAAIAERDARRLDGLLISDANGQVLTRSKAVQQRGDFIYHTTTWGRELAEGREITSVEEGAAFPLIVVGAIPMEREDGFLGSLVPAYIVNDSYAARFKERYLRPEIELAFHVPGKGVVGHSFDSEEHGRILSFYFNEGGDVLKSTSTLTRVAFNGDQYFVRSAILSGVEESPGRVLIFVPAQTVLQQAAYGAAALLAFLGVLAFAGPYVFAGSMLYTGIVGVIGSIAVFSAGYLFFGGQIEEDVVQLTRPTYAIYNSTMELDPPVAALNRQSEYRIGVRLFSGGEAINATEVQLAFDPAMLQVADIDFSRSWCNESLIIQREIDNEAGTVTIVCGVPNPGFSERSGIVADLFVQPLTVGRASLEFTERTRVLANDGLGTEVLRQAVDGSYVVVEQLQISGDQRLSDVLVFSPTHPNPERWYNTRDIVFTWTKREGSGQRYVFTRSPEAEFTDAAEVSGDSIALSAPGDGTHYFHLESRHGDGTVEQSNFEVNIDTEPPRAPNVRVSNSEPRAGELVRFQFSGSDALSGLQSNFYIKFNDGIFFPVGETFSTAFFEPGDHTITVRSFDQANNFSETTVNVSVRSQLAAALLSLF